MELRPPTANPLSPKSPSYPRHTETAQYAKPCTRVKDGETWIELVAQDCKVRRACNKQDSGCNDHQDLHHENQAHSQMAALSPSVFAPSAPPPPAQDRRDRPSDECQNANAHTCNDRWRDEAEIKIQWHALPLNNWRAIIQSRRLAWNLIKSGLTAFRTTKSPFPHAMKGLPGPERSAVEHEGCALAPPHPNLGRKSGQSHDGRIGTTAVLVDAGDRIGVLRSSLDRPANLTLVREIPLSKALQKITQGECRSAAIIGHEYAKTVLRRQQQIAVEAHRASLMPNEAGSGEFRFVKHQPHVSRPRCDFGPYHAG